MINAKVSDLECLMNGCTENRRLDWESGKRMTSAQEPDWLAKRENVGEEEDEGKEERINKPPPFSLGC